ncbi:MAG: GntR family transcriptional regulator [Verrucomicrobia bacterium]|nr:GntR family transcriptional regulator [Verrucomicrobiota bacterium]
MLHLGARNRLRVLRRSTPGLFLSGGSFGDILLPNRYVSLELAAEESIEVFVYRDSEDRLVATTETPKAMVGDVASLRVVALKPGVGAFLDWGLEKDLFLPLAEQVGRVRVGQEVTVLVRLDERSGRLVATMRLEKHLPPQQPTFREGAPVQALLLQETPLGYTALVEGKYLGLLYHEPHAPPVQPGERLTAHVAKVRPDGKIDLRREPTAARGARGLPDRILAALEQAGGRLDVDDDAPPERIQELFAASKKTFKQALGALYKQRRIVFTRPGIELAGRQAPRADHSGQRTTGGSPPRPARKREHRQPRGAER